MKYLFGYQRGVVISEQKKVLNESVWPIEDIAKGLKSSSKVLWLGTFEQTFAQWLRGLETFQDIKDINKYFSERGDMSLEELIYDEFDADDDEDKYWLRKFDEHFKSKGISTNFLSGKQGPIEDPNLEVATPQNSPENTPGPGEPSGSAPSEPKKNIQDKEGWNEIVKHYNATPYDKTWTDIGVYKLIDITHDDKKFILRNDGQILNFRANKKMGDWSWENDEPVLTFDYKVTNPATGFVSGDPEGSCEDEFCTNKKVAGRGATGHCVKTIQSMLLNSGLVDGIQLTKDLDACKNNFNDCDGIYGRETEKAVRKFQEENNISVDGIVGCETWGYL